MLSYRRFPQYGQSTGKNSQMSWLRYARDNFEIKKVASSSKKPSKWPIMCFSRIKNDFPHFQNQRYINSYLLVIIVFFFSYDHHLANPFIICLPNRVERRFRIAAG